MTMCHSSLIIGEELILVARQELIWEVLQAYMQFCQCSRHVAQGCLNLKASGTVIFL